MLHHFNDSRFGALADLGYGGRGKWFLNDTPDNSGGGRDIGSGRVGSGRPCEPSRGHGYCSFIATVFPVSLLASRVPR
jgi:hypothetical protein